MKDYQQYYQTVAKSADTTGQKPSIREYILIKLVDDLFIVLLFVLTFFFAVVGLFFTPTNGEGTKWALDSAKLCLGIFLGLFAGKKLR